MRTMEEINRELEQIRGQLAKRKKLLAAWEDLNAQRRERQQIEEETARILAKEHADVEELERMSFRSFLAALKGDKDERLSKERREELSAKLRHDQAVQDLMEIDRSVMELTGELKTVPDVSARLGELLEEKSACLRSGGSADGVRLTAIEDELAQIRARQKEIREAVSAGHRVLSAISRMESSLGDAHRMSSWDLWGGGLLTDLAKHEHLDNAQMAAGEIQRALREFRTELADVSMTIQTPTVEMDSFTKFADFFFDGLFADLAVRNRIEDAQGSVSNTRCQVQLVMNRLELLEQQESERSSALERERRGLLERS